MGSFKISFSMILSIIIVTYNSQRVLKQCLTSLEKYNSDQIRNQEYEVMVVDNASYDDTVKMVRRNFPTVQIIQNRENLGFGAANNQGVAKTRGNYVCFLNPDTSVEGDTLAKMVEFIASQPRVGIATCRVVLPSGELDDACHRGFPTPWRALTHFMGLGKILPKSSLLNGYHLGYQNMDKIHEIDACAGAFLLIRRQVGAEVGWYDTDYFWYGEDLDLCYRVKQTGYQIMFVPYVSITHQKGAASGIKKHSRHLAKIDPETKRRITLARFDVMRIFYEKHYAAKYPRWLTALVFLGIGFKQKFSEMAL